MINHLQIAVAIFILLLSTSIITNAQIQTSLPSESEAPIKTAKNAFHWDFGTVGFGIASNINYEFNLNSSESRKFQFSGRLGLGYIYAAGIWCDGVSGMLGTTGINMLVGSGNHHLDVNAGGQFKFYSGSNDLEGIFRCSSERKSFIPLVEIGYRYQKPSGGFLFRAHIGSTGIALGFGNSW